MTPHLLFFLLLTKKTRQGLNSLSRFQAREKTVHSRTVTRSRVFRLMKKQSIQGLFF